MKVAALLVNYRDADNTAAAARSVLADVPDTQVVVVDNSDDLAHGQSLRAQLPSGVEVLHAPGNVGFGRGCNLAVQYTDAPLLMLVNPDVRLRPGCIRALCSTMQQQPQLGAVAPRQFLDEDGTWMLPPAWLPTALRAWATEAVLRNPSRQPRWSKAVHAENWRCWTAQTPLRQRALSGGALMVRRSALQAPRGASVTLFDARFFMYFEDSDLCMRLRRTGWHLALVPHAHAVHAWRNAPHKAALMQQGMQVFFDKYYPASTPWQIRLQALQRADDRPKWYVPFKPLVGQLQIEDKACLGWCIEVSPHANLWPAVGRVGQGSIEVDLRPVAQALAGASGLWIRVSKAHDPWLLHAQCFSVPSDEPIANATEQ